MVLEMTTKILLFVLIFTMMIPIYAVAPAPIRPFSSISAPYGAIGVYNNTVYIEMLSYLPFIGIGNHTYIAVPSTPTSFPVPSPTPMRPYFTCIRCVPQAFALGVINDSYAVHYVLSHMGQTIRIFPPMQRNATFQLYVFDYGNFTMQPRGSFVVYYINPNTTPIQPFPLATR